MAEGGAERLVLTTSRWWLTGAAVACAATAVLGLWVISITDDAIERFWSGFAVFLLLLGVVVALFKLRKPPQLILTPEGFLLTGLGSPGLIRWSEVESFQVYEEEESYPEANDAVPAHAAWVLRDDAPAMDRLTSVINRKGGLPIDGSLPRNIGMKPEPLAALLEDWRVRHG